MTKPSTTYHPLGDYIRPVDIRNRDLKVTELLGLSIEKCFIPSIANTIGTDMSTYKIVQPRQFAYGPVTSRNGDKITIALYTGDEPAIISQAYVVFEIVDREKLLPEYLMMWFRRPEFDRYARYHSHGSAREIFDWAEMCATMVPVPPISEQRAVVADYEAVARRIAVAKRTIATLQATAQALYRKMFVDGIDKENLPEGWRWVPLFNCGNVLYGFPFDSELFCEDANLTPIIRIRDILENQSYTFTSEKVDSKYEIINGDILIGMDGVFHMTIWSGGFAYQNQRTVRIRPNKENFISAYQILFAIQPTIKELESSIEGTTVAHLGDKDMKQMKVPVAPEQIQKDIFEKFEVISQNVILHKQEIRKLTEIQTIMLSGMGR